MKIYFSGFIGLGPPPGTPHPEVKGFDFMMSYYDITERERFNYVRRKND